MKVEIKEEIYRKIEERVKTKEEFKDVEEYIEHILKQVIKKLESKKQVPAFSEEEEKAVKDESKSKTNLIDEAKKYFDQAQTAQQKGDWAVYGENIEKLESILNQL